MANLATSGIGYNPPAPSVSSRFDKVTKRRTTPARRRKVVSTPTSAPAAPVAPPTTAPSAPATPTVSTPRPLAPPVAAPYLDPAPYANDPSKPYTERVFTTPTEATRDYSAPFVPQTMDPYTQALKGAQLTYDTKARSIADYIRGQSEAARMAADYSGGAAREQANNQGLLSSTAAQKIVADYTSRATQPYTSAISAANTDLANLGSDLAQQAALKYQDLMAQYRNEARTDRATDEGNLRWRVEMNQNLRAYQDALARGDQATALDIWKTKLAQGLGLGSLSGSARDVTVPSDPAWFASIYNKTAPIGDPPEQAIEAKTPWSQIKSFQAFSPDTKLTAQKQMEQQASQFAQNLALERARFAEAKRQYAADRAASADPYSMMNDEAAQNAAAGYTLYPTQLMNRWLSKYGVDVIGSAKSGDSRAIGLLKSIYPGGAWKKYLGGDDPKPNTVAPVASEAEDSILGTIGSGIGKLFGNVAAYSPVGMTAKAAGWASATKPSGFSYSDYLKTMWKPSF